MCSRATETFYLNRKQKTEEKAPSSASLRAKKIGQRAPGSDSLNVILHDLLQSSNNNWTFVYISGCTCETVRHVMQIRSRARRRRIE